MSLWIRLCNHTYIHTYKWDAAAKDLPTEFLDSRNGLLEALQLVTRNGDDACHGEMLSSFNQNTTQGQRDVARLRSSSGGPAGAFPTAIPGGRMTLCNEMFVVSVWHRLGHVAVMILVATCLGIMI